MVSLFLFFSCLAVKPDEVFCFFFAYLSCCCSILNYSYRLKQVCKEHDREWSREWDTLLKRAKVLKEIDEHTRLMHHEYVAKHCMIDVHRDFVLCTHRRNLPNGDVVVLSTSSFAPQSEDIVPLPEDCIRGFAHIAGYHLAKYTGTMVSIGVVKMRWDLFNL